MDYNGNNVTVRLPKRVSAMPGVLVQELDGEMVLLNLQTEHYYGLDDVGTRMWELLNEGGDVEAVVDHILNEYDVDPFVLRRDLCELIAKLAGAGLINVEY